MSTTTHRPELRVALYERIVGISFWMAIVLAISYPPILYALSTGYVDQVVLLGVIGAHTLALALGRDHGKSASSNAGEVGTEEKRIK